MNVCDHVVVIEGKYEGYEGTIIGGNTEKNYISVNIHGIHALRFTSEQLFVITGSNEHFREFGSKSEVNWDAITKLY